MKEDYGRLDRLRCSEFQVACSFRVHCINLIQDMALIQNYFQQNEAVLTAERFMRLDVSILIYWQYVSNDLNTKTDIGDRYRSIERE